MARNTVEDFVDLPFEQQAEALYKLAVKLARHAKPLNREDKKYVNEHTHTLNAVYQLGACVQALQRIVLIREKGDDVDISPIRFPSILTKENAEEPP